ncbi:MAG: glycosyltransferase family 39 protein [Deltaproteobacteria bacterium]|nr:glycosyltransferase family 39 protein [Deltaproteobacteria bacterium]
MNRSVVLERLVVTVALLLTVWGIWSHGFWDPWELDAADGGRVGRLPGVVAGWLTCLLAFLLLRRHFSQRAGVIAIAVIASTPLFLLNARLLMGDSVAVFAQTWVGLAAIAACGGSDSTPRTLSRYVLLGIGLAVSTHTSGVLLGPLPPILAVAAWSLLSDDTGRGNRVGRWLFPVAATVLVLGVLRAASMDDPGFSLWLGGGAIGGDPPTFDKAAELVFHGFAPWSAALPVAAIWALIPRPTRSADAQSVAWVLVLWAAFAFVSWTVFASRYGTPPYLALVPLAGLVSIWLAEVSHERVVRWPAAVVVALLVGLLIRDYALYPDSPLRSLAVEGLNVPEVYNPRGAWALLFSIAGALLCLTLVSHEGIARPEPRANVQWFRAQWDVGGAQRGWLLLGALLLAACFSFGLMCFVLDLGVASIVVRVGRVAPLVPVVLVALVFGLPWLRYAYGRLGDRRIFPALGGGLAVGAFVSLSFQPALSQHFSPKPVYDAYEELTGGTPSPLASYKLPSTAAHYYTNAPIEEITAQADLVSFLQESGQRWAVIRADDLPGLNRAYRRETGEHLYVADARSARLLLLAAKPIDGRPNESFIANAVLRDVPEAQHSVGANFEDRVELVGYDLDLPEGDSVGAGQSFQVTWYWRVLGKVPSGYKVFVHIDGHGMRLNGDHVAVGGRYPTKLWEKGDVIVDTQELTVPANYQVGEYVIYIGLFSGGKRLEVKSGPGDEENRVNAGTLSVR